MKLTGFEGFTFTHCLACHGQAWRSPAGEVFCGTCEERAARLRAALASVARPPAYGSLKAALLGTTMHSVPQPMLARAALVGGPIGGAMGGTVA